MRPRWPRRCSAGAFVLFEFVYESLLEFVVVVDEFDCASVFDGAVEFELAHEAKDGVDNALYVLFHLAFLSKAMMNASVAATALDCRSRFVMSCAMAML